MTIQLRLLLLGLLVVAVSMGASLLLTHLSFQTSGSMSYRASMMIAAGIPLVVAPPSYGIVAMLTARLHRANQRLDELARRDTLTGLLNRRAFTEEAQQRLDAGGEQLFIMADIDHFKRINDTLGHAAGDAALQFAASVMEHAAPEDSVVARIGGEEFALLLPATTIEEADVTQLINVMRAELEATPFPANPKVTTMTCSFGVAASRPGEKLDGLLLRADRALYTAKQNGRDCMARAA